nr:immunoglobulin light chain junction region [Macaca mulatta]
DYYYYSADSSGNRLF